MFGILRIDILHQTFHSSNTNQGWNIYYILFTLHVKISWKWIEHFKNNYSFAFEIQNIWKPYLRVEPGFDLLTCILKFFHEWRVKNKFVLNSNGLDWSFLQFSPMLTCSINLDQLHVCSCWCLTCVLTAIKRFISWDCSFVILQYSSTVSIIAPGRTVHNFRQQHFYKSVYTFTDAFANQNSRHFCCFRVQKMPSHNTNDALIPQASPYVLPLDVDDQVLFPFYAKLAYFK